MRKFQRACCSLAFTQCALPALLRRGKATWIALQLQAALAWAAVPAGWHVPAAERPQTLVAAGVECTLRRMHTHHERRCAWPVRPVCARQPACARGLQGETLHVVSCMLSSVVHLQSSMQSVRLLWVQPPCKRSFGKSTVLQHGSPKSHASACPTRGIMLSWTASCSGLHPC